jgi:hypothetical protein
VAGSVADLLNELSTAELGNITLRGDGQVYFRSRHNIPVAEFTITDAEIALGSIEINLPWDVVRNHIAVSGATRTLSTVQAVYTNTGLVIPKNSTTVIEIRWKYNSTDCPATEIVSPVYSTDWTVSAGSGVITVTLSNVTSTGATLTIVSGYSASVTFTKLQVRGKPIIPNEISSVAEDADSIVLYKQRTLTIATDYVQDAVQVSGLARALQLRLSTSQKYTKVTLVNCPDLQFALDLGTIVQLTSVTAGIDKMYRLHWLEHKWKDAAGYLTLTDVALEPLDGVNAEYWILDSQSQLPVLVPF